MNGTEGPTKFVDAKGRELYDQYGVWQRVVFVPFWDLPMDERCDEEIAIEVDGEPTVVED